MEKCLVSPVNLKRKLNVPYVKLSLKNSKTSIVLFQEKYESVFRS